MVLSKGRILHPQKSVFSLTPKLIFLGIFLDPVQMKIDVTTEKIGKLKSICAKLIEPQQNTIREVSRVFGYMVSIFPGVMYGPLPLIRERENSCPKMQPG